MEAMVYGLGFIIRSGNIKSYSHVIGLSTADRTQIAFRYFK